MAEELHTKLRSIQEEIEFQAQVLRNVTDCIIVTDLDGIISFWNQGAENTLGISADEAIGEDITLIDPEFDNTRYRRILAKGKELSWEEDWCYKRRDGKSVWLTLRISPLRNSQTGEIIGTVGVSKDITEKKRLQELLDTTGEIAEIGGWEYDLQTQTPVWTLQTYKLFQVKAGSPITLDKMIQYFHEDHRNKVKDILNTLIHSGVPVDEQLKIVTEKGEERWIRLIGKKETDRRGSVRIIGTIANIHNQMLAAIEQRRSNLLFSELFSHAAIGVAIVAIPEGKPVVTNPALQNILGYSNKELTSMPFSDFTHPDDIAIDQSYFLEVIEGKRDHYKIPKRFIKKDGGIVWCNMTASTVRDENGNVLFGIGLVEDITEKRKAEDEIRNFNRELEARIKVRTKELEESNRELQAFNYMLSHDIRTSLRSVEIFSDLLERKYGHTLDDKASEFLSYLRAGVFEMNEMVNGVLDYAQVRNNELQWVQVDLNEKIGNIVKELTRTLKDVRELQIDVQPLPTIKADRALIRHAFANIIANSLKYAKPDGPIKLKIWADETDTDVTLHFEDNGIGFSEKHSKQIFQPFERLVNYAQVKGSGIGLAIVKRIVERHNGQIWAEGEPNEFARFHVKISK